MVAYLDQCENAAEDVTPTRGTVPKLMREVEVAGHKLFMDNYFSSPQLFSYQYGRKINSCGTVCHNTKDMPPNFGPKMMKVEERYLQCTA
jgi:hypothetical protein